MPAKKSAKQIICSECGRPLPGLQKRLVRERAVVGNDKFMCQPCMMAPAMVYYDLKRKWTRRIVPHLGDEELNRILVRDFNKYTWGLWRGRFTAGMLPEEIESCGWRLDHRGTCPRYWAYVKHAACHWVVNFALRLAMLAEPKKRWRILTSDEPDGHSTVWDGYHTLFDFNFQAMEIPPDECFKSATRGYLAWILEPGEELKPLYCPRGLA